MAKGNRSSRVKSGGENVMPPAPSKFNVDALNPSVIRSHIRRSAKSDLRVKGYRDEMVRRADDIEAASVEIMAAGFNNPDHYKDGTPYCWCPPFGLLTAGTVACHNARYDEIIERYSNGK